MHQSKSSKFPGVLLTAFIAFNANPAANPSPSAAVRATAPASLAVVIASSLATQFVTILTPRLTNSAIID